MALRRLTPSSALIVAALSLASQPAAHAQPAPSWADTPALLAAATAPVDDALRGCLGRDLPQTIVLIAARRADGATEVAMPMPAVGYRGLTPTERCLMKTVAKVTLPALPAAIERVLLGHVVTVAGAAPPAVEAAFADWRDPGAMLTTFLDPARRAALAACAPRARTVRVVLDLRKRVTRAWLPAWQFHSPRGDGTTPPPERRVKQCLARAVRAWTLPPLPHAMAELRLAIAVDP